jgi:signal transduction histidine kinase
VGNLIGEKEIPKEYLTPYLSQNGTFIGTMGEVLQAECIVAAAPIQIGGSAKGVVYAVLPTGIATEYIKDLLQILLISALVTGVLMMLAAYFMAAAMVRPLSQMSMGAKRLAEGDFSTRVDVTRQDEIGQLAQSFNAMIVSLEAGERMRKGFVANVSHELKTPMTTIAGFVDGILDGTIPADRQEKYLGIVSEEIKRLSRLVNTMLGLSKLESGETSLHFAPLDLSELLVTTALSFEQQISQKEITLEGLEGFSELPVMADSDLIHQVIYNLIDNSVKYAPFGGYIRISGWCEEGQVHVSVYNDGDGIDEQELPFLFDRFYKVDQSRGTDKNSLGLGLYLVKTIVNLHGGQITVRSAKGGFCEFELVLEQRV